MNSLMSFVAVALVITNVSSTNLSKAEAIQIYQDAMIKSESIQSAVMKADFDLDIDMGVKQSAKVSVSSKMSDAGKKMSIISSSTIDGKTEKTENFVQNGKIYTKQQSSNNYLVSDYKTSTNAAINQMSPIASKKIYSDSLKNAKNLKYSQKDGKLNISYDLPDTFSAEFKTQLDSLVGNNVTGDLKKEFNSAENKATLKESMGLTNSKKDKEVLESIIDAQVALVNEMQKDILDSMEIEKISINATVDANGYISNQKLALKISMNNPLASVMTMMDTTEEITTDKFLIDMTMNFNISKINENVSVTIPDFNAGNTVAA